MGVTPKIETCKTDFWSPLEFYTYNAITLPNLV